MHNLTEALALKPPMTTGVSTGLEELDAATGGLHLGQLWVITAEPGQGSSSLTCQWAARVAMRWQVRVRLLSPRDTARHCAARMLASCSRVPTDAILHDRMTTDQVFRAAEPRSRLADAELEIYGRTAARRAVLDDWAGPWSEPLVVLIDDAMLIRGGVQRAEALAREGALVVMSMPRSELPTDLSSWADLPSWWKSADVVVELQTFGLDAHVTDRPGEADVRILRNRFGPLCDFVAAFQAHYSRIVDMAK